MSGIVGMVSLRDPRVDRPAIEALTRRLAVTAPDGSSTWHGRDVSLGHALLRTREGSCRDDQPCTLDGATWIVADARIDGRVALEKALHVPQTEKELSDAKLILYAYRAWGDGCVERLLGDFSFAIWDGMRRRLFCARDPFGVKPFFHSLSGGRFSFANSLDAVRGFPGVPTRLDDLAIADFLLFEMRLDPSATAFAGIRRLPPGHCLEFSAAGLRVRRYWSLPTELPVRFRSANECIEGFREVVSRAVHDRVTTRKTAVLMSGGLDSPAVAAAALGRLGHAAPGPVELRAFAAVHDRLIPDRERHYSSVAAGGLGIPIEHCRADDYGLYDREAQLADYFPEPANEPHAALAVDLARMAASHAPVVLTGWDGDALLSESPRPYFRWLLAKGRWPRAASVAVRHSWRERHSLAARVRRRPAQTAAAPPFPAWINPQLAAELRLHDRWDEFHGTPRLTHPLRPYAHHVLGYIARRSDFFDGYTDACTGARAEVRHPLLDLRVIEFCLSVEPYPWCHRKELLRRALAGAIPEEVRLRPKTPLAGFPYMALLRRPQMRWIDTFIACPATERYVARESLAPARAQDDPDTAWMLLRPVGLDRWLRALRTADIHPKELRHDHA